MRADLLNRIVLRWDSTSDCTALLGPGGIETVWLTRADDRVASACRAAGAETLAANDIRLLPLDQAAQAQAGAAVAFKAGVWPGAQASGRGSGGGFSAGATQHAWVDSNSWLPAWLQALYPAVPPVLGYLPDADAGIAAGKVIAYDSLELALIDAWAGGGNSILAPDAACRDALLAGTAPRWPPGSEWAGTAHWLREHQPLFRQPQPGAITVLVEPGEATQEIATFCSVTAPRPSWFPLRACRRRTPSRRPVVVAAGIQPPSRDWAGRSGPTPRAGATVITDAAAPSLVASRAA